MCERLVDLLVCSLPLHRHSYIGFILAFVSSIHNKQFTQCVRGVLDPPVSEFSLSLYRHPFLYTLFSSHFTLIINNKNLKSFMSAIASTSDRLHSEFVRILFLQAHRKLTDFLQLQEFSLRRHTQVASSPFDARLSSRSYRAK